MSYYLDGWRKGVEDARAELAREIATGKARVEYHVWPDGREDVRIIMLDDKGQPVGRSEPAERQEPT